MDFFGAGGAKPENPKGCDARYRDEDTEQESVGSSGNSGGHWARRR
jgi:hypothetical protein